MKRKKPFVLAPDAAQRHVDCQHYDFHAGAPRCKICAHPYCLAAGTSPELCNFRAPRESDEDDHGKDKDC